MYTKLLLHRDASIISLESNHWPRNQNQNWNQNRIMRCQVIPPLEVSEGQGTAGFFNKDPRLGRSCCWMVSINWIWCLVFNSIGSGWTAAPYFKFQFSAFVSISHFPIFSLLPRLFFYDLCDLWLLWLCNFPLRLINYSIFLSVQDARLLICLLFFFSCPM